MAAAPSARRYLRLDPRQPLLDALEPGKEPRRTLVRRRIDLADLPGGGGQIGVG